MSTFGYKRTLAGAPESSAIPDLRSFLIGLDQPCLLFARFIKQQKVRFVSVKRLRGFQNREKRNFQIHDGPWTGHPCGANRANFNLVRCNFVLAEEAIAPAMTGELATAFELYGKFRWRRNGR